MLQVKCAHCGGPNGDAQPTDECIHCGKILGAAPERRTQTPYVETNATVAITELPFGLTLSQPARPNPARKQRAIAIAVGVGVAIVGLAALAFALLR
jgi:hypothetical protein